MCNHTRVQCTCPLTHLLDTSMSVEPGHCTTSNATHKPAFPSESCLHQKFTPLSLHQPTLQPLAVLGQQQPCTEAGCETEGCNVFLLDSAARTLPAHIRSMSWRAHGSSLAGHRAGQWACPSSFRQRCKLPQTGCINGAWSCDGQSWRKGPSPHGCDSCAYPCTGQPT